MIPEEVFKTKLEKWKDNRQSVRVKPHANFQGVSNTQPWGGARSKRPSKHQVGNVRNVYIPGEDSEYEYVYEGQDERHRYEYMNFFDSHHRDKSGEQFRQTIPRDYLEGPFRALNQDDEDFMRPMFNVQLQ